MKPVACDRGQSLLPKRPILVTGSHRSGTTWVGRTIAASRSVGYIHEPFNIKHRLGICSADFPYWFTYISGTNETAYRQHLLNTLQFRYRLGEEIKTIRNAGDFLRLLRDLSHFLQCSVLGVRPLLKDPIAIFSAEWLASTFRMEVIIMVRHPAAFASSLKRLDFNHPFSHFLIQRQLMQDYLCEFESEIAEYAKKEHCIIDQACLLWRLIHHVILMYRKKHKEWLFIRHEDLSRNPVEGFKCIFNKLRIPFTENIRIAIEKSTNSFNPSEIAKPNDIRCNSKANIYNWKKRLTQSEISKIRKQVEHISSAFYSDQDW
ncbi:MAG: sulfotransferase [Planctomycetes bacterium]|nr:sulfotransferase [Planctomycetota bacterium]